MANVLLITEDQSLTRIVSWILTERKFEITACETVDDAIGSVARQRPDVVILNGAEGEAMQQHAKRILDAWPETRVIELYQTGPAPTELRARTVTHLHKPFDADDLVSCIDHVMDQRREA